MKKYIYLILSVLLMLSCVGNTNAQSEQDFTSPKYTYTIPYFNGTSIMYSDPQKPGLRFQLYTYDPRYNWYSHVNVYVEGTVHGHMERTMIWSRDFSRNESSNGLELLLDVDSTHFDSHTKLSFFIYTTQYAPDPNHQPYDYYHFAKFNYMAQISAGVSNRAMILVHNQFESRYFSSAGLLSPTNPNPVSMPEEKFEKKHFDTDYIGGGNNRNIVGAKLPIYNILFTDTHGSSKSIVSPDWFAGNPAESMSNEFIRTAIGKKIPNQPQYNLVLALSCHSTGDVAVYLDNPIYYLADAFNIGNGAVNKSFVGFDYYVYNSSEWALSVLDYLLLGDNIYNATRKAYKKSHPRGSKTNKDSFFGHNPNVISDIEPVIVGDKKMKLHTLYKKSNIGISWANVEVKPLQ
jgi:hypothetical protein